MTPLSSKRARWIGLSSLVLAGLCAAPVLAGDRWRDERDRRGDETSRDRFERPDRSDRKPDRDEKDDRPGRRSFRDDRDRHWDDRHRNDAAVYHKRVWVEPVYRTVCDRIWVEPVWRDVCDRVWVEPVYEDRCERVWVPDRYEDREVIRIDFCGNRIVCRETVLVEPGHWAERRVRVCVREGYWEDVRRREIVCEGHWKTIERRELVREGFWTTQLVRERDNHGQFARFDRGDRYED